jgi:uncharacterized protein YjdB
MRCGGAAPAEDAGTAAERDPLLEQLAQATTGEYQILTELGRGGMAVVYLAEDLALGRQVAVKMMIPGLPASEGMADRFLLEARTAAQLGHPHIIPIYAVRMTGHLRFFVMKFVPGRSLDRVLAESGPLPIPVVQALLAQVGAALEHAHARGVIHRDIKPANIMLDEDGSAIVADFGIAKVSQGVSLTHTGSAVGTPTYMSPEQCTGNPVTGASDQYALGCVAFELLAGRPPFVHPEVIPVLLAHVGEAPPPLLALRRDCPIELAAVVDKMLAKDPSERWPSLTDAIEAADAASFAASPTVRAGMRSLAAGPAGSGPRRVVSGPISPLPIPAPTLAPTSCGARGSAAEAFSLSIHPNGAVLQAGAGLQLRATARDRAGLPVLSASIEWNSSAPDVATVSPDGVVTARQEGTVAISARSGEAAATIQVRVTRVPAGRIRITLSSGTWRVGERRLVSAVVLDQGGAILPGRAVQWMSLDPAVAVVSADGAVHATGPGRARLQALAEEQTAETVIEVEGASGDLGIVPGEGALAVGQVVRFSAVLRQPDGRQLLAPDAVWSSSDPTVLRTSADGEVTAFRPGTVRVKVSSVGKVFEVGLQVTRVDAAEVRITPRPGTVVAGEEVRFQAQAADRLGTALQGRIVSWASSRPELASIDGDGRLHAHAPGTVRISAVVGGGLAWLELRITPRSIAAVRIQPAALVLRVGETIPVQAAALTSKGTTLPDEALSWQSSDPGVAVVSATGEVTGVRFGVARIAATAGTRRATIPVEVRAPASVSSPRVVINPT